jgi:hypothetical protein
MAVRKKPLSYDIPYSFVDVLNKSHSSTIESSWYDRDGLGGGG